MRHDAAVAVTRAAVAAALADPSPPHVGPGDLVVAAVSGGPDSLALAAALAHVAPKRRLRAGALVIDHGLQPDSAGRAGDAAEACRSLGLHPVAVERVEVDGEGGPEAAARAARYRAIQDYVDRCAVTAVLLGHTLDDQAETVLLRLARGSGARSLSAMRPRTGRLVRPFLGVRRSDTAKACAALGLHPWSDPQNNDPAFARARVRADALPALEAALGPGVVAGLARSARLLADDADALDGWADDATGSLDVDSLRALPRAVRTRVLRRAAVAAGSPAGSLSADHVDALDRLVTDWHGQGPVTLPGALVGERRYDRLWIR